MLLSTAPISCVLWYSGGLLSSYIVAPVETGHRLRDALVLQALVGTATSTPTPPRKWAGTQNQPRKDLLSKGHSGAGTSRGQDLGHCLPREVHWENEAKHYCSVRDKPEGMGRNPCGSSVPSFMLRAALARTCDSHSRCQWPLGRDLSHSHILRATVTSTTDGTESQESERCVRRASPSQQGRIPG